MPEQSGCGGCNGAAFEGAMGRLEALTRMPRARVEAALRLGLRDGAAGIEAAETRAVVILWAEAMREGGRLKTELREARGSGAGERR